MSKKETISEEMRILYVALTRAKEKLIITGMGKEIKEELEKKKELLEIYRSKEKINPILLKKYTTYKDWIELIYISDKLKEELEIKIIPKKELEETEFETEEETKKFPFKEDIDMENIERSLNFVYPYLLSSNLPLKSTVSKVKEMQNEENYNLETDFFSDQYMLDLSDLTTQKEEKNEFFIKNKLDFESQKPKFLTEIEKISNSEKGSLVHFILQKIDFTKDYNLEELESFINTFVLNNTISLSQAEAINKKQILDFLNSDLAKQFKTAKQIYREKTFCTKIRAKDIFKESDFSKEKEENYILVQGIIDLFFEDSMGNWNLVDYKTDYIKAGEEYKLIDRYRRQLEIYKKALEDEIDTKVLHTYIYSLALNKKIEL